MPIDDARVEGRKRFLPDRMAVLTTGLMWGLVFGLALWVTVAASTDFKEEQAMTSIAFSPPRTEGSVSVETALARRRSVRAFAGRPLRPDQLGQILWAAQGITGRRGPRRTTPSAGALFPLEVYVIVGQVKGLEDGVYRYRPQTHDLITVKTGDHREAMASAAFGQGWMAKAPVTLAIAGVVARTAAKYGRRAGRYVAMEAGHAAQNIYLQAQADGLGTTAVGAFQDEAVKSLIGMTADEMPLYLMPVGVLP